MNLWLKSIWAAAAAISLHAQLVAATKAGLVSFAPEASVLLRGGDALIRAKGAYRFNAEAPELRVLAGPTTVHWENRDIRVTASRLLTVQGTANVRRLDPRTADPTGAMERRSRGFTRALVPPADAGSRQTGPTRVTVSRRIGDPRGEEGSIPKLSEGDLSGCAVAPW